ncbi:MAG: hypothetical protein R6V59_07940 [Dehalococcoidia bacterium]
MKKWMYVVIGVVVVVAVVLAVRLAPERPLVENDVNDVVNDVPDNGIPDNDVPDNDVPDNDVPDIATATSLHFTVEWTNDEKMVWTYMAKDIGTENLKLRIEMTNGYDMAYVVNGELREVWVVSEGEWVAMPDAQWDEWWDEHRADLHAHISELHDWTHGDWTYTEPITGYSVRIYNIQVDPHISDALFEP